MLVRTKKRHISRSKSTPAQKQGIKATEHFKDVYGELPEAAVYLAGLRYREDLTQKELGELIGVEQPNISKMERGERPIGKDVAKRLAGIFKIDYRLFL